jgi:hypothetical protein
MNFREVAGGQAVDIPSTGETLALFSQNADKPPKTKRIFWVMVYGHRGLE